MAILKRRGDGGYFISGPIADHIATLQVSKEGANMLKQCGLEKGSRVPKRLLSYMWDMGLVFTKQSNSSSQISAGLSPHSPSIDDKGPRLAIRENGDSWSLAVLFPELPLEWIQELFSNSNDFIVQHCGICVDDIIDSILPITRLWPGKGGSIWPVVPHTKPYIIEPIGSWPSTWDLGHWTKSVDGLNIEGTLFKGDEDGGVRLAPGKPLESEANYYFVFHHESHQLLCERQILPMPLELKARFINLYDGWEAWIFKIPSEVKKVLREWSLRLGHSIKEPTWKLKFVSPPPLNYTMGGLPSIPLNTETVFAVIPPAILAEEESVLLAMEHDNKFVSSISINTKTSSTGKVRYNETSYFGLSLQKTGFYRLQLLTSRADAITFNVVSVSLPTSLDVIRQPLSLEVYVTSDTSGKTVYIFTSLHQGIDEVDIYEDKALDIQLICPISVDVSWSCGIQNGRKISASPEDAAAYMINHLHIAFSTGNIFMLQIDAGNFGLVQIRFHPMPIQHSEISNDIPHRSSRRDDAIALRVRWLSTVITAHLNQRAPTIQLSSLTITSLSQLRNWPEGRKLVSLTRIPRAFLPNLYELVRMLDQHEEDLL
jgi:hypothetical protein